MKAQAMSGYGPKTGPDAFTAPSGLTSNGPIPAPSAVKSTTSIVTQPWKITLAVDMTDTATHAHRRRSKHDQPQAHPLAFPAYVTRARGSTPAALGLRKPPTRAILKGKP